MATRLDLAIAQFVGFHHGSEGYNAKSLAEAMGLTKNEWKKIRSEIHLPETDKEDIDELFLPKRKLK